MRGCLGHPRAPAALRLVESGPWVPAGSCWGGRALLCPTGGVRGLRVQVLGGDPISCSMQPHPSYSLRRLVRGHTQEKALVLSPLREAEEHPCAFVERCDVRGGRDQRNQKRELQPSLLTHPLSLQGPHLAVASPGFQSPASGLAAPGGEPGPTSVPCRQMSSCWAAHRSPLEQEPLCAHRVAQAAGVAPGQPPAHPACERRMVSESEREVSSLPSLCLSPLLASPPGSAPSANVRLARRRPCRLLVSLCACCPRCQDPPSWPGLRRPRCLVGVWGGFGPLAERSQPRGPGLLVIFSNRCY